MEEGSPEQPALIFPTIFLTSWFWSEYLGFEIYGRTSHLQLTPVQAFQVLSDHTGHGQHSPWALQARLSPKEGRGRPTWVLKDP